MHHTAKMMEEHRQSQEASKHVAMIVDCSKGALAWSLGQKVVLSLMAIGGKGQSILWLNPLSLPSLGSVGIQLDTGK